MSSQLRPVPSSAQISIPITADALDEDNESFSVSLSAPTHATIGTSLGIATIVDDDAPPTLSVNDVALAEGGVGTSNATFTVTLSAPSGRTVSVSYATSNSTATAPGDYSATSGALTFAPGVLSLSISVPVLGDVLSEGNESLSLNLTDPINSTISDSQGVATISDDDAQPTLRISDVAVVETDAGSATATFDVSLSAASGQTVTVAYATVNGSAMAPGDYVAASGTLTFAPGTTSQPVAIVIAGDTLDEGDESFAVTLTSSQNASISDSQGSATISDNDQVPTISVSDVTVTETNTDTTTARFVVSLSAASGRAITVNYASANASAISPGDYAAVSGVVTFAPGTTARNVDVLVAGDTLDEPNEVFSVTLASPVDASVADGQGIGTILDNDAAPSLKSQRSRDRGQQRHSNRYVHGVPVSC